MIRNSFILLPCHSLEDFPVFHTGDDAASILANWTALWNPHLISRSGKTPQWFRVDEPPEDSSHSIVFIPTISVEELPTGYGDRLQEQNSIQIPSLINRAEINEKVQSAIGLDQDNARLSDDLAKDFFALGYVYLQVQLMARMLRYTSYLDDVQFENLVTQAASQFVEGNSESTRENLTKCFDLLCEERNRFYPMDAYLLDLVLVAPTTTGKNFRSELDDPSVKNFLIGGATLDHIRNSQSESYELLGQKNTEQVNVVSGQFAELPTQLLSVEALHQNIAQGIQSHSQLGDAFSEQSPVFASRRFGLGNRLPCLLDGFGFAGAIHATFDEGFFPEGSHPNINWEGIDGESVNAAGRTPISAESADAFLNLGVTIGESLDSAHTASLVFAHWPNRFCQWYEDLRRASQYADVLGTFVTCSKYFSQIEDPGFGEEFTADQYSTPFFKQAVIRNTDDPISRWVRYWHNEARLNIFNAAEAFAACLGESTYDKKYVEDLRMQNCLQVDRVEKENGPSGELPGERLEAAFEKLKNVVAKKGDQESLLVLNPLPFARRVFVDCKAAGISGPFSSEKPVYASDPSTGSSVIDVPACGFAELVSGAGKQTNKAQVALAEDSYLRNEFFELQVDSRTGGIRSIHRYDQRSNLFSQQISMRYRSARQSRDGGGFLYSKMKADEVKIVDCNHVSAKIQSRGSLMLEEEDSNGKSRSRKLADFVQSIQVVRGSRIIECEVELMPEELPKNDPWNSYYCLRFAWPMESGTLQRSVNGSPNAVPENRFEAPQFIEIDDAANRVLVLTNGLPYHRRVGYRQLDSILISANESVRKFRFGIGINVKNALQSALDFSSPVSVFKNSTRQSKSRSAFLFHFDHRSIVATNWEPVIGDGKVIGVRVRLLETQNRDGQVSITAPYEIQKASRIDFAGKLVSDGKIKDGNAEFDFVANAYFQVELIWRS